MKLRGEREAAMKLKCAMKTHGKIKFAACGYLCVASVFISVTSALEDTNDIIIN